MPGCCSIVPISFQPFAMRPASSANCRCWSGATPLSLAMEPPSNSRSMPAASRTDHASAFSVVMSAMNASVASIFADNLSDSASIVSANAPTAETHDLRKSAGRSPLGTASAASTSCLSLTTNSLFARNSLIRVSSSGSRRRASLATAELSAASDLPRSAAISLRTSGGATSALDKAVFAVPRSTRTVCMPRNRSREASLTARASSAAFQRSHARSAERAKVNTRTAAMTPVINCSRLLMVAKRFMCPLSAPIGSNLAKRW
jgi:hypothetical protein